MLRAIKWLPIAASLVASVTVNISFAAEDIVIGQSAPITGPIADVGQNMALGVKIYFDYVNDNGGIFGRKIKRILKDDVYKVPDTVKNIKELVEKDNVVALIASAGTSPLGEVVKQQILETNGTVLIAPYTGSSTLREPFEKTRHFFHIRASYAGEAEGIVDQLMSLQLDKIAVFYQNDGFGKVGLDGVVAALKKRGKTIVSSGTYESTKPDDVQKAADDIMKGDPSAVVIWGTGKPAANFIKATRTKSRIAQYVTVSVASPKQIYDIDGPKIARGVGIAQVMPYVFSQGTAPIIKEYYAALKKYGPTGATPNYTSLEEFIGAKVLVEGIKRGGPKVTRESIYKGLETMNPYDVGGFKVSFSPTSHAQSNFVEVTVISKNGSLIR
ncbi:MAG TPA: ABC transporter substrate-binding protein [Burkholderiaceae bacterium]|jgi:ABC-type branched-subunit amino acid transport system substrate-binding protein